MNLIMIMTAAIVLLVSPIGLVSADTTSPNIELGDIGWYQVTAEEHLASAQNLEQEIASLKARVLSMTQKVSELDRKPYLDPKNLRRDSLKRMIGTTLKKISSLRDHVAWHRTEASRLAAGKTSSQELHSIPGQTVGGRGSETHVIGSEKDG